MKRFMTRKPDKERLRAALLRQPADHVPYWEAGVCRRNLEFLFERKEVPEISWLLGPEDQLALAQMTGQDAIPVAGVFSLLARARVKAPNGALRYLEEGELKSWDMLERLVPYSEDEVRSRVEPIRASLELVKDTGLGVWSAVGAFWQQAWQTVGFNDFMMKVADDLDFVRRLIEYLAAPAVTAAEMLCEYPLTFLGLFDNIATSKGPFIAPDTFKPLWCPWAKAIAAPARAKGIPAFLNTDGKLDWVLDDIVDLGFDAINPVDPNGNDIFEVKENYGDKLCLVGGVNQAWPLGFGTPEEVDRTVKDCIERLGRGGGYVVTSSHDIGDNVPPENWVAMIQAVEKYG